MKPQIHALSEQLETHRFELEMSVQELQEKNQILKEREEYLSNMIDNASEGIITLNYIGLIESANEVSADFLGYDVQSLKNKPINLFINNEIKQDISAFIIRKYHQNPTFKIKGFIKNRHTKDLMPVQISISMLTKQSSRKFLVILTDLSETVKMQQDLAFEKSEKERLQKINADLDKFVYKVSHDLRAPLASSIGLVALAKNEKNIDKIHEYLDLQDKNLTSLQDFIGSILEYSKNSRNEVAREEIDFRAILDKFLEQNRYSESASSIDFNINVLQTDIFYSDKIRLEIILNNLISNAIKYSDPNKQDKKIEININSDADFAEIKITDNGIGIEEEYLEKIFNPFVRATNYNNGSGIGLALVEEAVTKIAGYIHVESEYRKYTSFVLHLPSLHLPA